MATYTVQIEFSGDDGRIWQALDPAEVVEDDGTAQDLAEWTKSNQNLAEGGLWRVLVWEGADEFGDLGKPAAVVYSSDEGGPRLEPDPTL